MAIQYVAFFRLVTYARRRNSEWEKGFPRLGRSANESLTFSINRKGIQKLSQLCLRSVSQTNRHLPTRSGCKQILFCLHGSARGLAASPRQHTQQPIRIPLELTKQPKFTVWTPAQCELLLWMIILSLIRKLQVITKALCLQRSYTATLWRTTSSRLKALFNAPSEGAKWRWLPRNYQIEII